MQGKDFASYQVRLVLSSDERGLYILTLVCDDEISWRKYTKCYVSQRLYYIVWLRFVLICYPFDYFWGVDTTATALTCLILILLQNQDLQTRMQEEINGVFPEGVFPSLSKRQQTPFTEAVILELLRYISHVPLAVPHSTLENATICGYHIDANATVFFQI